MNKKHAENLTDDLFDNLYHSQYVPNQLENYNAFKEKKKQNHLEKSNRIMERGFKGILKFAVADPTNKRVQELPEKFIFIESNPIFNESIQNIAKELNERNFWGLVESDFDELIGIADSFCNSDKVKDAIDMYQALIILFPDRVESWLRWAYAESADLSDYKIAMDIYIQCLDYFDHPSVHFLLGTCYLNTDQPELAKDCFRKAIELCDKYDEKDLKDKIVSIMDQVPGFVTP